MALQIKNRREDLYIKGVPPVIPDGIVTNTDYATADTAGVIKYNNTIGTTVNSSGVLTGITRTEAQYASGSNGMFICKGTLENIFAGLIQKYLKEMFLVNVMEPDTSKNYAVTMEYNSVTQEWGFDFHEL